MLGAMIGDIVGSRFERHNIKSKAILDCKGDYTLLGAFKYMQEAGRHYPNYGFGGTFIRWIFMDNPILYRSFGNGAAMRISPCGFAGTSLDEVKLLSKGNRGNP